ncbi:MAG: hypothetical protein NVS4B7_15680 [Ktedonobacteraceae bacterium]
MALYNKTKSVTPRCPNAQKKDLPPPIDPQLQLKWGLALLGKEKAAQYLIWKQHRLSENSR